MSPSYIGNDIYDRSNPLGNIDLVLQARKENEQYDNASNDHLYSGLACSYGTMATEQ